MHPETCPPSFLPVLSLLLHSPSLFLLDFVLFGALFLISFFMTPGRGGDSGSWLGWGRRWPWSWGSVYLKALSSLSLSLCLSFFLLLLPLPIPWLEGAFTLKPWGEDQGVSGPPHPVLVGGRDQGPVAYFLPLVFIGAV